MSGWLSLEMLTKSALRLMRPRAIQLTRRERAIVIDALRSTGHVHRVILFDMMRHDNAPGWAIAEEVRSLVTVERLRLSLKEEE
jgi:hypothetical protein